MIDLAVRAYVMFMFVLKVSSNVSAMMIYLLLMPSRGGYTPRQAIGVLVISIFVFVMNYLSMRLNNQPWEN